MSKRTAFPKVFWVANTIEVLERFAYYGIYMGFLIYATDKLNFEKDDIGQIQSWFLAVSYLVPLFSGSLADKYGFKKVLLVSYIAYIPSVLFLLVSDTYAEVTMTMLSIAFAAGIFKPLISGTVRAVTDSTNKSLGFGVFYAMVNIGGSFGPLVAAKLRVLSWNYAFIMAAVSISIMFFVTIFFYKEPPREKTTATIGDKLKDIGVALSDIKFSIFLLLLGVFFWLPFWAFFNTGSYYVDKIIDSVKLYSEVKDTLGVGVANFIGGYNKELGNFAVTGESIAHTGWMIIIFQLLITRIFEKKAAIPSFVLGMFVAAMGFLFIALAFLYQPSWVFLGIFLFAIGEMISSPRIQEYITWLAPKEKAGLYMGTSFLATFVGGLLSGFTYTKWLDIAEKPGRLIPKFIANILNIGQDAYVPHFIWYLLAIHLIVGALIIMVYVKFVGSFKEKTE